MQKIFSGISHTLHAKYSICKCAHRAELWSARKCLIALKVNNFWHFHCLQKKCVHTCKMNAWAEWYMMVHLRTLLGETFDRNIALIVHILLLSWKGFRPRTKLQCTLNQNCVETYMTYPLITYTNMSKCNIIIFFFLISGWYFNWI